VFAPLDRNTVACVKCRRNHPCSVSEVYWFVVCCIRVWNAAPHFLAFCRTKCHGVAARCVRLLLSPTVLQTPRVLWIAFDITLFYSVFFSTTGYCTSVATPCASFELAQRNGREGGGAVMGVGVRWGKKLRVAIAMMCPPVHRLFVEKWYCSIERCRR
jgi:hypothetical protein